ncbi:MAG: threonine/serine exporter family protein [Luteolibacter sp.]
MDLEKDRGSASACRVADLLLDMGSVLMVSGAHCGRISRNIERVAEKWGYSVELFLSFTGLMVSIKDIQHPARRVARFRRCPLHGVHFGIVTEISLLSWRVLREDNVSIDEVERCLSEIKAIPHHPRWLILVGLGSACACLCMLAGGNWKDACITFIATFAGMFARQEVLKRRFNPMIGFIVASFVTTMIAGMDMIHHIGVSPEKALATSVLYLIPGVPLINCTIDLIEGYIPTAIARGVFGGFILLCIAVGMSMSILLLGIHNF